MKIEQPFLASDHFQPLIFIRVAESIVIAHAPVRMLQGMLALNVDEVVGLPPQERAAGQYYFQILFRVSPTGHWKMAGMFPESTGITGTRFPQHYASRYRQPRPGFPCLARAMAFPLAIALERRAKAGIADNSDHQIIAIHFGHFFEGPAHRQRLLYP